MRNIEYHNGSTSKDTKTRLTLSADRKGRETLTHPVHGSPKQTSRLAHMSRSQPDKLWVGEHLLTREEVFEVMSHLGNWLATGKLSE